MFIVAASVSRRRLLRASSCSSVCERSWLVAMSCRRPMQLAAGDLVEDGGHLVEAQQAIQHVAFERRRWPAACGPLYPRTSAT